MSVVLRATWTVTEGKEEDVLGVLRELAALSRQEPGCRLYQPYIDPAEPRVFHIFEIYDDQAALDAHTASDHFQRLVVGRAIALLEDRARVLFDTIDE